MEKERTDEIYTEIIIQALETNKELNDKEIETLFNNLITERRRQDK